MKNSFFPSIKSIVFTILIGVFYISIFSFNADGQKNKTKISEPVSTIKEMGEFDADNFQIFTLINAERVQNGLNALLWDDKTAEIARSYSERMANENFFSHFDSNGQNVLDRAKAAKLKHYSKIGENLFSCENVRRFDAFAVKNWMKSPTHRENILFPEWTATGIGIAKSEEGEIFITQIFIKR